MWYCGMMWYVSSRASIGCCVSVSAEVATTLFIVIIITIINIVNKMDTKFALISGIQFIVNHGFGVAYHISYINIYISNNSTSLHLILKMAAENYIGSW